MLPEVRNATTTDGQSWRGTRLQTESMNSKELPENKRIFRYWVEVRDLTNGSVRNLPLTAVAKIHIPRSKKEGQRPTEEILQLKDGSATLEAKSLDDLAAQLRERYPDGAYERTLHQERNWEAEVRREEALHQLAKIVAEAVVRDFLEKGCAEDVPNSD